MNALLRAIIPRILLRAHHFAIAYVAKWWCGHPSRTLVVIGVTGTHGKSSVVMLLGHVLTATGHRTGWFSTATVGDGEHVRLNTLKMTMPGRFALQRFLRSCVEHGCTHAVIETSSEGLAQHRHRGVAYDVAVITNLGREHLDAHGGFAQYRAAKAKLFRHTAHERTKRRIAIVPKALERPEEFTGFAFSQVLQFGASDADGLHLERSIAAFPENVAAVLAVTHALGIDSAAVRRALANAPPLPGRLECIDRGQPFTVIVDYAHTPEALEYVYRSLSEFSRVVHVLGGVGGGRDRWKRPVMGAVAAAHADLVIVTNEDPYDDDPAAIIEDVARGAREWIDAHGGATLGKEVRTIHDRREALLAALVLAHPGDLVLVTGKGCEQAIIGPRGQRIPWDDRVVVGELIESFSASALQGSSA